jgi:hypothetical protein
MWEKIKELWLNESKQELKSENNIIFIDLVTLKLPLMEGYDKYYDPQKWEYYKDCTIISLNFIITTKDETIIKQDTIEFKKNNTKGLITLLELLNFHNIDTMVCYDYNYTINILLAYSYYVKNSYLIKKLKITNGECLVMLSKLKFHKKHKLKQLYKFLSNNEDNFYNNVNLCKKCYFVLKKI